MFPDQRIGLTIEHRTVEARSVLLSMSTRYLAMLVDLTIQALPPHKSTPWNLRAPGGGSIAAVLVHLRRNYSALPNLRTLAVQQPRRMRRKRKRRFDGYYWFDPEGEWRWQWYVVELKEMYGDRVQVVLEWWFVRRAGHVLSSSGGDEMVRARGVVGNCDEVVCRCTFEMTSRPIVADRGEWVECWRNRGMGFDKDYESTRRTFMDDKSWVEAHRSQLYPGGRVVTAWQTNVRGHLRQVEQQIRCRR